MELANFTKIIVLPTNLEAPKELKFEDIIARPLLRTDLTDDLAGVNSSVNIIRETRGGSWPSGELTAEEDFLDLAWHEREFGSNSSFAYVVYSANGEYIGCFYLYGMGVRTELTETLAEYDVDASWWVTTKAFEQGYYEKLYYALQTWLIKDFPFTKIYYSNKQIPSV
ncbi:GNAT family N-acetyltransferase [bacterium]|nr:GNAT family N-acetyltransferase [bacterium]